MSVPVEPLQKYDSYSDVLQDQIIVKNELAFTSSCRVFVLPHAGVEFKILLFK